MDNNAIDADKLAKKFLGVLESEEAERINLLKDHIQLDSPAHANFKGTLDALKSLAPDFILEYDAAIPDHFPKQYDLAVTIQLKSSRGLSSNIYCFNVADNGNIESKVRISEGKTDYLKHDFFDFSTQDDCERFIESLAKEIDKNGGRPILGKTPEEPYRGPTTWEMEKLEKW